MKHPLLWLIGLGLLGPHLTGAEQAAAATPAKSGRFIFNVLPKSLQSNPEVDFNIICEMTDEGRKLPPVTPENPTYYLSQPGGFAQMGLGSATGEKPPAIPQMEHILEQALAMSGYLGAAPGHPPGIVIVYSWGSHSSPPAAEAGGGDDPDNHLLVDQMLERARLVGGEKFGREFTQALAAEGAEKDALKRLEELPPEVRTTMRGLLGSLDQFRRKNDKNPSLMEDAIGSVYFVVASAYDFASATTDNKVLLWRTKMTVNSTGVAMSDALLPLITAAAPYFGKDMTEPEIVVQRIRREGTVKLGPLKVQEYDAKTPAPAEKAKP